MRRANGTGPEGDLGPQSFSHMKPRRPPGSADQDATGEGVWRFIVVGTVLVIIVSLCGGVSASADSGLLREDEEDASVD